MKAKHDSSDMYSLSEALEFEMPFGKHVGSTLFEISEEDPAYLDWLTDMQPHGKAGMKAKAAAIKACEDPAVARRVDKAVYG